MVTDSWEQSSTILWCIIYLELCQACQTRRFVITPVLWHVACWCRGCCFWKKTVWAPYRNSKHSPIHSNPWEVWYWLEMDKSLHLVWTRQNRVMNVLERWPLSSQYIILTYLWPVPRLPFKPSFPSGLEKSHTNCSLTSSELDVSRSSVLLPPLMPRKH